MMPRRIYSALLLATIFATAANAATVAGTLRRNPDLKAGADEENRVLLFTPKPYQEGSTHSHFDTSASPNLLMEPAINSDLKAFRVDLTKQAMQDMGWPSGTFAAEVEYSDAAGEGFKDPILGDARKVAFEASVAAWSAILGSSVPVRIEARFREQRCEEGGGATLASAGPVAVFLNFAGGEPGVWYAGPLAEALAGQNLSADDPAGDHPDLRVTVNSLIDEGCLGEGRRFYYGLDGDEPPGELSFITVVMHEIGHGLGFLGLLDARTGELFRGDPDIFTRLTFDTKKQKYWDELTNKGRKKSAKRSRKVVFDGASTTRKAGRFLKAREVLEISAPEKLAGNYDVGTASFGPKLKKAGVSGDLVLVDDGSANPTYGCRPILNGSAVRGNIAVIDRGECFFTEKVRNAQDAGAVGAVIVHNESGAPPPLGGSDPSIVIPSVRVGKADGRKIKRELRR